MVMMRVVMVMIMMTTSMDNLFPVPSDPRPVLFD